MQPSGVMRHMGTDIYLQGTPTAPLNLPEIRVSFLKLLRPERLSPDAAMMVLMTKLPSKLLSLASVYRPTARVHAANGALMVGAYKHVTGISRHANTDKLWGPWEHGRQSLTRSAHSWQTALVCEWVRQGAYAKKEFWDSQAYSLQTHQALMGGVPCGAYLGAVHSPPEMLPPHSHAAASRGRSGHAHVDAGPFIRDNPHLVLGPGAPVWGQWRPVPPSGSLPDLVWQYPSGGHPPDYIRNGAVPGLPSPRRPLNRGLARATRAYPETPGADPQGNPKTTGVADPPNCCPSCPNEAAPAAVAGSAQTLDAIQRAHLPSGRSHWRPSGQNHPHGDRVPQGTAPPGDPGHGGYDGGGKLGAETQGVPLTHKRAANRHHATPPLGSPPGYSSARERATSCSVMGRSPP